MEALCINLEYELKRFHAQDNSIESVFIGGGTPSTISPKLYAKIFDIFGRYLQNNAEITIEANPNSATKEWLLGMYRLGANRISFGVQSFDTKKLKLLNRSHSPKMAADAIQNASEVGFCNISMDIIYGVHTDTKELLKNDLKTAFLLPINHLSAYSLTIEPDTPFAKTPQMADEKLKETKWLFNEIEARGFKQYEISNFGSYQSIHNLGYWQYKDYIGVGSGAVGKKANKRFYPQTSVEKYIKNPLEISQEELSKEDMAIEKIFLGFRSKIGVDADLLTKKELSRADILLKEGKLTLKNTTFYNTDYLLADEIALFLSS